MSPDPKSKKITVGVDLGATKVLAGVLDESGQILSRDKTKTNADKGVSEVIRRILNVIDNALKQAKVDKNKVLAVGIGCPGPLNPDTGVVECTPNMPGWVDIPLKTILEQHLGIKVYLENDVNVGTYGEFRLGAGVGAKHVVGIFIGTGIGGGLILNGKLWQGFNKNAGEIGHMVIQKDGPVCGCGRKGCYEALAARPAIAKRIVELSQKSGKKSLALEGVDGVNIRSGQLARAWQAGDEAVRQALTEMCQYTGIVIANTIHLLNPEVIILGGGVMEALGNELVPLIEQAALKETFPCAARNVRIRKAMLGDDAGIIGAAFLARERMQK
jgi:glucokinase